MILLGLGTLVGLLSLGGAQASGPLDWLNDQTVLEADWPTVAGGPLPRPPLEVCYTDLHEETISMFEDPEARPIFADPLAAQGLIPEGRTHRSARADYEFFGIKVTSRTSVIDPTAPADTPRPVPTTWSQQQSVKLPVFGRISMFGQLAATSNSVEDNRVNMTSRTGLEWSFVPWKASQIQLRGGPIMRMSDPSNPVPEAEQARLALEVNANTELYGPLKVEYTGSAMPALSSETKERVNQDVRLSVDLTNDAKFHVGTRYWWEGTEQSEPWTDRMQLYLGLTLKR